MHAGYYRTFTNEYQNDYTDYPSTLAASRILYRIGEVAAHCAAFILHDFFALP
jgi:hypothetical protein